MKKIQIWILAGLFIISLLPVQGLGQTSKEVLDKMIEAQGGRKAMEAIKDTTISGTMELIQQGMNATMTMYQKEPNMMRMDIEVMGMIVTQAFDGQKAWYLNPQTGVAEEMPENLGKEIKRQAMGNDSILNPEKYGITYEFIGKEKVGDKDSLVMEQTMSDGHKSTLYVDPATYLTFKTKTMTIGQMGGGEVLSETLISDYRKEGDLMAAHSMTINQDGAEFARMTLTRISYNSSLQDSLFKMAE